MTRWRDGDLGRQPLAAGVRGRRTAGPTPGSTASRGRRYRPLLDREDDIIGRSLRERGWSVPEACGNATTRRTGCQQSEGRTELTVRQARRRWTRWTTWTEWTRWTGWTAITVRVERNNYKLLLNWLVRVAVNPLGGRRPSAVPRAARSGPLLHVQLRLDHDLLKPVEVLLQEVQRGALPPFRIREIDSGDHVDAGHGDPRTARWLAS